MVLFNPEIIQTRSDYSSLEGEDLNIHLLSMSNLGYSRQIIVCAYGHVLKGVEIKFHHDNKHRGSASERVYRRGGGGEQPRCTDPRQA